MAGLLRPPLSSIKPDVKVPVDERAFFDALSPSPFMPLPPMAMVEAFPGAYYIDGCLSREECQGLCDACDQCQDLRFWSSAGRDDASARAFRDADTVEVRAERLAAALWARIHHLLPSGMAALAVDGTDPDDERELLGAWEAVAVNYDCLFAKYPSGGAFAPHTDGRAIHSFNVRSFYSIIVFLNDVPEGSGGGTRFYAPSAVQNLRRADGSQRWTSDASLAVGEVASVAGRMLIFDQSLVHEGVPPQAPHLKYIIRSDVMYERTPKLCDSDADRCAYELFKRAEDVAERGDADEAIKIFKKATHMMGPLLREMMAI